MWVQIFADQTQPDWQVRYSSCFLPTLPAEHILVEDSSGRQGVIFVDLDLWIQRDTIYYTVDLPEHPEYVTDTKVEYINSWMLGNEGEELDIVRDNASGMIANS